MTVRRLALAVLVLSFFCGSLLVFAGGPRGAPPVPVSATWDAGSAVLVITFDRPIGVRSWPPLPIIGDLAVRAGSDQWSSALTVEIGGDVSGPNRQLWVVFNDPVSADPPADGAVCDYTGDWIANEFSSLPVAPFTDFPCSQ